MSKAIDDAFDIEPYDPASTELIDYADLANLPSVNVIHPDYDTKDSEIEEQFQAVYDKAMDAFDSQVEDSQDIEGKYLARNSEVANQLLTTALQAAKEKASLKQHSDHLKIKKDAKGATTNIQNNVMMDRNDILKMMKGDVS